MSCRKETGMGTIQITRAQPKETLTSKHTMYKVLYILPIWMLVTAFCMASPQEIMQGMLAIFKANDILITDYLIVGGVGAALFNSAMVMILNILLLKKLDLKPNGIIIATLFLLGGFAFMGKNILNILPFYLGGYCYARYHGISYKNVVIINMLSTTLSPLSSVLAQSVGDHWLVSLCTAILISGFIGFVMPPISSHTLTSHSGYSIYNMGFAGGLVGVVAYAILESLGLTWTRNTAYNTDPHLELGFIIGGFCLFLIGTGYFLNEKSFKGFKAVFSHSGRLVTDLVKQVGFGLTLINMGVMGIAAMLYAYMMGGMINGPIVAAVLTVIGFSAFGKHLKNCYPIVLGVTLAGFLFARDVPTTTLIIAALFGTSLAPIAGEFGPLWGIVVGFVHLALTLNVGDMHGGLHLYNNGFSAGIIATLFIPMLDAFRKDKRHETRN
ncbi:MAG: DUF1576 domain-containing protein [Cellulosilyticaceae bacterium]